MSQIPHNESSPEGRGALAGLRVLDFTRQLAGPFATVMLADHGAEVVKVESLPDGDPSRTTGAHFIGDESAMFLMWNRGKRSIALDLRQPEAIEIVRRMVPTVDVIVENYRPGVAAEIGIGYEALAELNPALIYCSISAFGSSGPLARQPGTDPVVQAMSGIMSVTGEPDGGPALVGAPIADFTGALLAVQGILLALAARADTGLGQKVEVPMLSGLLSLLTSPIASYWATGEDPVAHGGAHATVVPYAAFRTADGHAVAGVWGGSAWRRFCVAVDRPDLEEDPRFADNVARFEHRDELERILGEVFATRTTAEWEQRFRDAGALFGPVHKFSDALSHPQVEEAGLVRTVDHPSLGPIRQLGPPVHFSRTPGQTERPPPAHGEHTEEILRDVGLTTAEIDDLAARRIVKRVAPKPAI